MNILRSNIGHIFRSGGFRIRRIRPGNVLGAEADPAFGPLRVVDRAQLSVGTVVRMHEHNNDEILTYMWKGSVLHEDSAKQKVVLSPSRLMMMNAGRSFWHEESAVEGPIEALQIFIRPRDLDLPGAVHFFDRPAPTGDLQWNLIGGPERSDAPLKIRQEVWVYDAFLPADGQLPVPTSDKLTPWLYVMAGSVRVGTEPLTEGEAISDLNVALPVIHAETDASLVLFLVDRSARGAMGGTISGV